MSFSREEVELLIRGLDTIEDEYTGTSDFDPVPIEALRRKLRTALSESEQSDA